MSPVCTNARIERRLDHGSKSPPTFDFSLDSFIAGTTDSRFRALNIDTGEELWSAALPNAGNATPMTYQTDGTQYVVIAAGGHQRIGEESLGDAVVAFALP